MVKYASSIFENADLVTHVMTAGKGYLKDKTQSVTTM